MKYGKEVLHDKGGRGIQENCMFYQNYQSEIVESMLV
jgi:hypothetical protein